MKNLTIKYRTLLSLILLLIIFNKEVFCCQCFNVPPCVSYSEAEKIFTGKLQKTEKNEDSSVEAIDATFLVDEIYKGNVKKTESVKFEIGSCERDFVVGLKYFVYVNKDPYFTRRFCDRTSLLYEAKDDLEYVNNLSNKSPKFSIIGDIYGIPEKELSNIKIQIRSTDKTYNLITDKFGHYEFKTTEDKVFNVEILFPFTRGIYLNDVIVNYENNKTIAKYPARFVKNGCSYRTFEVDEK